MYTTTHHNHEQNSLQRMLLTSDAQGNSAIAVSMVAMRMMIS